MTYDSLDRLTEAEGPYGSGGATASITYSYDELGNLTANSQVGSYTYPTSGSSSVRPHAVSTAGSNTYTYDGNGNMTGGAGRSFPYNLENKPLTITISGQTTTFVYDGDNGRVKKIVGSTTTRYISQLYECENTNCSRMIFAGSERVATLVPSGGVQYYHPDHLGSSSVITDETGAKVQVLTYYPYGATRTNSSPVTPAVDVPYKYTGQELDASTDLYNYEARQYEAALGRFVSPDTVVPDPFNPQDLNRYSYVRNNPFLYNDPSGQEPLLTLGGDFGFGVPPAILQAYNSLPPGPASQNIGFGLHIFKALGDKITQHQYDTLMNIFAAQKFDTSGLPVPSHLSGNDPSIIQVPEVKVTAPPPPVQLPPVTIFPLSPPPLASDFSWVSGLFPLVGIAQNIAGLIVGRDPVTLEPPSVTNVLIQVGTIVSPLANKIAGFTKHGINQAITRGISPSKILDAVNNPLRNPLTVSDPQGRISTQFIGKDATVYLNAAGEVITVHGTHSNLVNRLLGIK